MEGKTTTQRKENSEKEGKDVKEPARTRKSPLNSEPNPAEPLPKKGVRTRKVQLKDGVINLKEFLELKAKARSRPDTETSCSVMPVSTAVCRNILLGEDDRGEKLAGETATQL